MCNRLLQGILSIPILLLMILGCEDREEGKTEEGVTAVGVVSPFEEPPDYFLNSIGSR